MLLLTGSADFVPAADNKLMLAETQVTVNTLNLSVASTLTLSQGVG